MGQRNVYSARNPQCTSNIAAHPIQPMLIPFLVAFDHDILVGSLSGNGSSIRLILLGKHPRRGRIAIFSESTADVRAWRDRAGRRIRSAVQPRSVLRRGRAASRLSGSAPQTG